MMINKLRERTINSIDTDLYKAIDEILYVAAGRGNTNVEVDYKEIRAA